MSTSDVPSGADPGEAPVGGEVRGDRSGRVLAGRYELGQMLGSGGMAEVYAAADRRLGRTVAVKVLRPDLARDESVRSRFRREAQSAASLNHPTVVAVHDTGDDASEPFIVMEYVPGHTLRDVMQRGQPMPTSQALAITAGVLTALEIAHRAGIVHRDIKPGNVMITPDGAVKVMDFGIARAMSDDLTITQTVVGTPAYLSPEHAEGRPVDVRSDLYSTGCVLFELLTGRPPFVSESAYVVAVQHIQEEPPAPSTLNPALPPALDQIVATALVKDRELRYQTAAQFRADLAAVNAGGASAGAGLLTSDGLREEPTDPIVLGPTARLSSAAMSALPSVGPPPAPPPSVPTGAAPSPPPEVPPNATGTPAAPANGSAGVPAAAAAYFPGGQGSGLPVAGPAKRRRWPWTAGAAAGLLAVAGVVFALLQGGGDGGTGEPTSDAGASEPVLRDVISLAAMGTPSAADRQNSVRELSTKDTVTVLDAHDTVMVLDPVGTVEPWVEPQKEGTQTVVTIATDVLFDFGSAEVGEGGDAAVRDAVEDAPDGATIDVTGYTDSVGGEEGNLLLSQQRADAVAAIIRSEGRGLVVNPVGKGSADEVEPNSNADGTDNPEGRAKNRRVEIRYG